MSLSTSSSTDTSEQCAHAERNEGRCTSCGHCNHDVILNGECMACAATEFETRIEPPAADRQVVPLSRLSKARQPKPGESGD